MSANAVLSFRAFLISSADTYGYSPYSKKLGHWCSRTNLTNAGTLVFQSSGKPSRFSKTVFTPYFVKRRSEEHTSELQSRGHLVCRLLLEKKKKKKKKEAKKNIKTNNIT